MYSLFLVIFNLLAPCVLASSTRLVIDSEPIMVNNILNENSTPILTAEDSYLNITQLAKKYGYLIEQHSVTTEDGYILGLHRLTAGTPGKDVHNKIPIFLMHGLLQSSDSYILLGPGTALGYLLLDKGFDVWMGNARGTKHSLSHKTLSSSQSTFWDFSWEEIGRYDLPAMIDYVLEITKQESLYYVGHSQGTTSFFVMNSLKPGYNTKVKMMFALSPVAWMSHTESLVVKHLSPVSGVFPNLSIFNTLSLSIDALNQMSGLICSFVSTKCNSLFDSLFGHNYFVNEQMLPAIVGHSSGASILQFLHYGQLHQSGRFCRFDHGWVKNLQVYGAFAPPDYELSNVTMPVVLFYSTNDCLSSAQDVATLYSNLPNVHKTYYSEYFTHIDYMYANVAKDAIYLKIINEIDNFELDANNVLAKK